MNRTRQKEVPAGLQAAIVRYAGGASLERHAHSGSSVSVVLAGAIQEEVGRTSKLGRVGSIVAKPAGLEHRNQVGPDGAILLAIKGAETDEPAREWRWTEMPVAAAVGIQVARSLKRESAVDMEQLLDLLGLAVPPVSAAGAAPKWIAQIRSQLDDQLGAPSVVELAQLADVHPVYLARAFRTHFGCSIREYRRRGRIQRAADLLANCHHSIAEIAARLDFFDQSHLCRDFRAELNLSPSEYRAIIRS